MRLLKFGLIAVLGAAAFGCGGGGVFNPDNVLDGVLTTSDNFSNGHYYDVYEFVPQRNGRFTFGMSSDVVDPYLVLEDLDENVIAEDDDSGEGRDAQITVNLREGDSYFLLASGFRTEETGPYQIGWEDGVDLVDVSTGQQLKAKRVVRFNGHPKASK